MMTHIAEPALSAQQPNNGVNSAKVKRRLAGRRSSHDKRILSSAFAIGIASSLLFVLGMSRPAGASKLVLKPAMNALLLGTKSVVTMLALRGDPDSRPPAAPPTITASGATPNPVVGTKTTLWANAFDDQGGHLVTYVWSQMSGPTATLKPVASAATATFTQAATYVFRVAVTNLLNEQSTNDITVTVNQTLTSITVTPPTATVALNAKQPFTATVLDQFGNSMPSPGITWSVPPALGAIDGNGLFTAGAMPGKGKVLATFGRTNGVAEVTVPDGSPTVKAIGSVNEKGTLVSLGATATDAAGREELTYDWKQTGGPNVEIKTPADPLQVLPVHAFGRYKFEVTVRNTSGLTANDEVFVDVNPVENVTITPANATVTRYATPTQPFTATVKDQFGNPVSDAVTWRLENNNVGLIDPDTGLFTPRGYGNSKVTATTSVGATAWAYLKISVERGQSPRSLPHR